MNFRMYILLLLQYFFLQKISLVFFRGFIVICKNIQIYRLDLYNNIDKCNSFGLIVCLKVKIV